MGPQRGGRVRSEGTDVFEGSGADKLVQKETGDLGDKRVWEELRDLGASPRWLLLFRGHLHWLSCNRIRQIITMV